MKGRFYTKPITKQELKYLRSQGYGEFTKNGGGTYHIPLVVEDKQVLKFLNEYRNSIRIKTVSR